MKKIFANQSTKPENLKMNYNIMCNEFYESISSLQANKRYGKKNKITLQIKAWVSFNFAYLYSILHLLSFLIERILFFPNINRSSVSKIWFFFFAL